MIFPEIEGSLVSGLTIGRLLRKKFHGSYRVLTQIFCVVEFFGALESSKMTAHLKIPDGLHMVLF